MRATINKHLGILTKYQEMIKQLVLEDGAMCIDVQDKWKISLPPITTLEESTATNEEMIRQCCSVFSDDLNCYQT